MKRRLEDGVNTPLKYLSIPGPNASDIGLLWNKGILQQNAEGKLNVAICDKQYADEVANNLGCLGGPLIHSRKVLVNELENLRSPFREHFPFDVINLDICDCLIPVHSQQGLNTLRWIFRLQQGQSFLLLVTTTPEQNPTSTRRLLEIIEVNLLNEEGFRNAYTEKYGSAEVRACLQDATAFSQMVIPKAIAEFGRSYGYRTYERFAARYQRPKDNRPNENYDMVCHSLEFEPIGKKAPFKYRPRFDYIPTNDNEERLRIKLAPNVEKKAINAYSRFVSELPTRDARNVIEILGEDARRKERLEQEAISLDGWWKTYAARQA